MTFIASEENIVSVFIISLPDRIAADRSVASAFCCVSRMTFVKSSPAACLFSFVPTFAPPFFSTWT